MTSLRHRVPRDPRYQDLISSERLSEGRLSFISDTHDEKKVDAEACGSSDTTLGGTAEKVCAFSNSLASVTEIFVVVSQRGCCGGVAATS